MISSFSNVLILSKLYLSHPWPNSSIYLLYFLSKEWHVDVINEKQFSFSKIFCEKRSERINDTFDVNWFKKSIFGRFNICGNKLSNSKSKIFWIILIKYCSFSNK